MEKIHHKRVVLTGELITGCFRHADIFQILPAVTEAPRAPQEWAHHPVIIEYCFDKPAERSMPINGSKLKQPDSKWIAEVDVSQTRLSEILRLMSVLTKIRFFRYDAEQAWFIPLGEEPLQIEMKWGQKWYELKDFNNKIDNFSSCEKYENVKFENQNAYYNSFGKKASFPEGLNDLLEIFFSLNEEARKAFLTSCTLFCNALDIWPKSKSWHFAALISSIETLNHFDSVSSGFKPVKCESCETEIFSVTKKFKNFVESHAFLVGNNCKAKQYVNDIYKMRSKILHAGELLLGDIQHIHWDDTDGDLKSIDESRYVFGVQSVVRICLVNWLFKQKKGSDK